MFSSFGFGFLCISVGILWRVRKKTPLCFRPHGIFFFRGGDNRQSSAAAPPTHTMWRVWSAQNGAQNGAHVPTTIK